MPIKSDTTNSQSSSNALHMNILNGTCDDECVRSVNPQAFTHFLASFLFNSKCDKTKDEFFNIPCATPEGKNAIIHGILKTGIENFRTKNLFNFLGNYIKIHKDSLSEKNIEDLIFFTVHYDKAFRSKLILGETINNNDIITFSAFLYFFRNLLTIPNIKECDTRELIHTPNAEKLQNITFGELKSFEFVIGNTVELLNDFSVKLNSTANNFTEENLLSYLENAGALGFEFKIKEDFQFYAEQILHQTQQLLSSLSPRNYSDEFKKSAAWTFLSSYHHNHAEDIESYCQTLFGLENCLPPDDESTRLIFNKIRTSDLQSIDFSNTNYQLVIDKLSQGTSTNIETQLNELSHINKLTNIITFLKDYLKKNNPIDEAYVKKTFRLTSSLFNISNPNTTLLRNIENKLDIRFFKMIQAQIAFTLNLVKHNSTGNHCYDKDQIISQLQNLTIAVIQSYENNKYSINTDESVKNIPKSYLDIINYCKDVDSLLNEGSKSFANAIYKIAEACLLNPTVCNNTQIKQQSFEILGGMVRKFDRAHRKDLAKEVINSTKKLKDFIARSNITNRELGDDVANFLRIRHSRNQVLMDKDCRELFGLNLIDCGFDTGNTTNVTFADPIPAIDPQEIVRTELPTSLNNASFDQAGNTATADDANNDIIANQPFSLASKLGTAIGLGACSGFLNGGSQIILHIAEQKNCSLQTRRFLAVTLAMANSFAISSLPLIYSIIENLANEETDSLVNSQKLLTCTYAFITSVVLQSLNAGMQYALPKKSILKNLFNMLPLFAGLWMLANSEEGAIESLAILGTHILTSMAASSLTYFSFKRFVNQQPLHSKTFNPKVKYGFKKDAEEGAVEMEGFLNQGNKETPITSNDSNINNPVRLIYFIKQTNLDQIRSNLNSLCIHLAGVCSIYEDYTNFLDAAKENLPNSQRAVLDETLYSGHLESLKKNLEEIKTYIINLGFKEIQPFQDVSYRDALKTAFKMKFATNFTSDEDAETNANTYIDTLKISDKTKDYSKFLKISTKDENYASNTAYPQHNQACIGFSTESLLVENKSVVEFLTLAKKINEAILKFKENLLKVEGVDKSLPKGVFDEIKYMKDYIGYIQTEISENIIKKFDNYNQSVQTIKNTNINGNGNNPAPAQLRKKASVNSIQDSRRITFHGGSSDCSYRTSSGDESTSSGIGSEHDPAEHQEKRFLVRF